MLRLCVHLRISIPLYICLFPRQVQFEISDIMTVELEDEAYDVIYSRDSILFIREKYELFKKLFVSVTPSLQLNSTT